MDPVKRERLIELGAQITGLRTEIATRQAQLAEIEAELDQLFSDTTPSPNASTNGTESATGGEKAEGPFSKLMAMGAKLATEPSKRPELTIPSIIGSLSDQALAVIKANPDHQFSGETLTNCLNRMARTVPANLDSVNAALSRLTTDGLILRVERGLYKAKPAMNTS